MERVKSRGVLNKILFYFLIVVLLFSCVKNKEKVDTSISGLIVNPKIDYIIISQGNRILDTIPLNSENYFNYTTNLIKSEGLFTLRHKETQVFFLKPGDSLVLHLNTRDFDESLNYSGRGAAKNNLLMSLFLMNQNEHKNLSSWYTLSPEEYTKRIDSLRTKKLNELEEFLSRNEITDNFKEVALASINYDYYSKKELYGTANRKRIGKLPDSFYNYRKNVDFGNEKLQFYYPYYWYLIRFFDNITVERHPFGTERGSLKFNKDKLLAIDSLSTSDSIRNSLSKIITIRFLVQAKKEEEQREFLDLFLNINNNQKDRKEVHDIFSNSIEMSPGKTIANIPLLSMENTNVGLHDIIKNPTVIFFWSSKHENQSRMIHERAAELEKKYPDYDFIGINTENHFRKWRSWVTNKNYTSEMEYQFENSKLSEKKLVLTNLNKVIIVDKNNIILDGSTNMFRKKFETKLLGYLNRP